MTLSIDCCVSKGLKGQSGICFVIVFRRSQLRAFLTQRLNCALANENFASEAHQIKNRKLDILEQALLLIQNSHVHWYM